MRYQERRRSTLKLMAGSQITGEKQLRQNCLPKAIVAAVCSGEDGVGVLAHQKYQQKFRGRRKDATNTMEQEGGLEVDAIHRE